MVMKYLYKKGAQNDVLKHVSNAQVHLFEVISFSYLLLYVLETSTVSFLEV